MNERRTIASLIIIYLLLTLVHLAYSYMTLFLHLTRDKIDDRITSSVVASCYEYKYRVPLPSYLQELTLVISLVKPFFYK